MKKTDSLGPRRITVSLSAFALALCAAFYAPPRSLAQNPAAPPPAQPQPTASPAPVPGAKSSQTQQEKPAADPATVTEGSVTQLSTTVAAPAANARGGIPALPAEKSQPVRVARFESAPAIDGKLDEEVWRGAAVLKDFYQTNPGDNTAPSYPTEALLGYDSRFLYIGFRAHDDPAKVRATIAKRDNVLGVDDSVRILIDTFNDKRRAYVLCFNPFGVQQDGIRTEGVNVDFTVDIVMESKGVITPDGYTVEVAVPFKSLRYEAGKGKLWGVQVFRQILRLNSEQDSWMPISRNNNSTLAQAGHVTGLENISTERTVELIPSLTVSETGRRVRSLPPVPATDFGRIVNEPVKLDPGLTAKFGISPTMTLDLALNPDFAQVEADQLVVTTNQRFPIFFPERRPFFLEGVEIFQTPITVVHTRAIVDPDAAVKLTGKRGPNTYGLLFASDNGPGNFTGDERLSPRNLRFLDKNAYIGVLRLKHDVGSDGHLGVVATSYNFIEKHNQVGGVDGRFRFDPQTTLSFQVVGSTSRNFFFDPRLDPDVVARPEQRRFPGQNLLQPDQTIYRTGNGFGYSFDFNRAGRNLGVEFFGEGETRDYRADVGFIGRNDTNFNAGIVSWDSTPKTKAALTQYHLHNFTHIDYDFRGRMQIWESEFNTQWFFRDHFNIGVAYEYAYERLFEEEFGPKRGPARDTGRILAGAFAGDDDERSSTKNHYFLNASWVPNKTYTFSGSYVYRDGHFDFDFGTGSKFPRASPAAVAQREAQAAGLCDDDENLPAVCFDPALDPGPGGLTQLSLGVAYQPTNAWRTTLNYTKNRLRRYDTDLLAFDVNLISLRTTYQFTRFLFARARVDYETLPSRARGQFLLGWTPNPGTAFYAGYNDDATVDGFSPINGRLVPGFRRNGRTFFIKFSYLIRKSFGG
ncbi:MAG TPA: DUF5916 domain-containing protein [Pyrinomonadaceae bacterium]|jgi:hypothetical protein